MAEEAFSKYAKFIIYVALAYPAAALFLEWEISPIYFVISGGIAVIVFERYFIEKSKVKKIKRPEPGPQQPFPPPNSEAWVTKKDMETGEMGPEKTHQPPKYTR